MDLDELKQFLKVDGSDLDVVLAGYQAAAEQYLANAGVTINYPNALYKVVVSMIVGTFLENPNLVANSGNMDGLSMTIGSLIAQLRLSQVTL